MSADALFWVLTAVALAAVTAAVVWPLVGAGGRAPAADDVDVAAHDLQVYRDQLSELSRDRDRGLIAPADYAAAKLEIERRLLAAGSARPVRHGPAHGARLVALSLVLVLPAASLSLYLWLGAPGTPSRPFAERSGETPGESTAAVEARLQQQVDSLAEALQADPTDVAHWLRLAATLQDLGRANEAVEALRRARPATGGHPAVLSALGEAQVVAAEGVVTPDAQATFRATLAARPGDPRAAFYLGLADAQAGRDEAALERWVALAGRSPADAPWLPALHRQIAEAAGRLGRDPRDVIPEPAAVPAGPSQDDIAAAAEMSDAERAEMIRGMVARLEARLAESPDDIDGWVRLARAYSVLGDARKEAVALERLIAMLGPDEPVRPMLERRLRELRAAVPDSP